MVDVPAGIARTVHRLMVDYTYAVDDSADAERVVRLFTPEATIDFSSAGFGKMEGEAEIRAFYSELFGSMAGQFHDVSNFRPVSWDGKVAVGEAYVLGMGQPRGGAGIRVQVRYRMECVEHEGDWRCRRLSLTPMMPVGA